MERKFQPSLKANVERFLVTSGSTSLIDNIRQNTKTRRPCGDDVFVVKIEELLGRRLGALPWGRPRKADK